MAVCRVAPPPPNPAASQAPQITKRRGLFHAHWCGPTRSLCRSWSRALLRGDVSAAARCWREAAEVWTYRYGEGDKHVRDMARAAAEAEELARMPHSQPRTPGDGGPGEGEGEGGALASRAANAARHLQELHALPVTSGAAGQQAPAPGGGDGGGRFGGVLDGDA